MTLGVSLVIFVRRVLLARVFLIHCKGCGIIDKRPETTADILSRSTALADGFASGGFANKAFSSRYRRQYTIDLVAHMAECDLNYERLMRLFPNVLSEDQRCISLLSESREDPQRTVVELQVLERSRYTTLIQLVQRPQLSWGRSPNMRIRMYHDAKSAEVVEYQHQNRFHGSYEIPNRRMRQRDEKVQLNQFLGEYLRYCLAVGGAVDVPLKLGG